MLIKNFRQDYAQGFGGKYGVQRDRQDKSALGYDEQVNLSKHESQTGKAFREISMVFRIRVLYIIILFPGSEMFLVVVVVLVSHWCRLLGLYAIILSKD